MQAGSNVVDFALDTKIAAIRDQSAVWMIAAWKDLAVKHELIKNAWQNQARLLDAWQPSVQNIAEQRREELFNDDVEHDVEEEVNDSPEPEDDEDGKRFADRLLELQSAEMVANLKEQAADAPPISIELLLNQMNDNWCDSHAALEAESAEERERNERALDSDNEDDCAAQEEFGEGQQGAMEEVIDNANNEGDAGMEDDGVAGEDDAGYGKYHRGRGSFG